jgi:hypothetical protein
MANGDVHTDIANEHLDLYRLLRHHQVLALQLGEHDLHHFEQWGDRNAQDPPHWQRSLDWLLLLDVLQQLAIVMEKPFEHLPKCHTPCCVIGAFCAINLCDQV